MQLTVLSYHATDPRAIVVHPKDAAADLATVMDPIRLPIETFRAPFRATVVFADKHVFRIELFEARTIRIKVGTIVVKPALEVGSPPSLPPRLALGLLPLLHLWPQRYDSSIEKDSRDGS